MLTSIKNNKSLTFYQSSRINDNVNNIAYGGGATASTIAMVSYNTTGITTQYNNQLNDFLTTLHAKRQDVAEKVANGLSKDPNYRGARNDGVKLAWDYEKADIDMGGKGSENWHAEERREIMENGRLRNSEGHHQRSVAKHPEDQGDPDNIKFYRSRQEHKDKGHNGDFRNESDAPKMDKDNMLKKINDKRVFKNELKGIGIAAAIGAGVGFTIGFAATLAQSGITPDTFKYAIANGVKSGASSGIQSIIGYGIGRTIGKLATDAVEGLLMNAGYEISINLSKVCTMGTVGVITIAVFSIVQFIKLVHNGESIKESLIHVGKQALFSLSLLAVSMAAQLAFGGPAGIIVSVSSGIIILTYNLSKISHDRKFSNEIREYIINKYKPKFEYEYK